LVRIEILKGLKDFLIVGKDGLGDGVENEGKRLSEEMKLYSRRLGWVEES
jgi:hypothetical protein